MEVGVSKCALVEYKAHFDTPSFLMLQTGNCFPVVSFFELNKVVCNKVVSNRFVTLVICWFIVVNGAV